MEIQEPPTDQDHTDQTPRVDLNSATTDELIALPGIGPVLAGRVIAYREARGPFPDAAHLTAVSGIGESLLARIANSVFVLPEGSGAPAAQVAAGAANSGSPTADAAGSAPPDDLDEPRSVEPEPVEEAPMMDNSVSNVAVDQPAEEVDAVEIEPSQAEGEAEVQVIAEGAPQEVLEPEPSAPTVQNQRRSWSWLWSTLLGALLGGLLGMILALLVFSGINGALDVRRSTAFRSLKGQVDGLSVEIDAVRTDVSTVQGDIDGLRQRVEVLSGLTARMEQAESTIDTFGRNIESLQTGVDEVNGRLDDLGQEMDSLRQASAQTMSFFEQLRTLLDEIFGTKEPQGALPSPGGVN
jgi:competence ComEA-like helix-hairpin-helix protein